MTKKIHTLEEFNDMLQKDISWRKKEILEIRTSLDKKTIILGRVLVVFLYAHWEGAVKAACKYLFMYINGQETTCNQLSNTFFSLYLYNKLFNKSLFKGQKTLTQVVDSLRNNPHERFCVKEVNTKSNLGSKVIEEITTSIGINYNAQLGTKQNFIDKKLVSGRNSVAHGDNEIHLNKEEIEIILNETLELMNIVQNEVIEIAEKKIYLKEV